MTEAAKVTGHEVLRGFQLDRILNEDARQKSASLFGHFTLSDGVKEDAIILVEKTHFSPRFYDSLGLKQDLPTLQHFQSLGTNDVYTWLLAWMSTPSSDVSPDSIDAHVKLTVIRPATQAHVIKYTEQSKVLIVETPQLYADVVQPWIVNQPIERIQWVYNILDNLKEADTILYEEPHRFIIVPDLKWDRVTLPSLYLVAIVHDRTLRSMRDLTRAHVPLLRDILRQGERIARERFALGDGEEGKRSNVESKLRCFIHYHPTYYDYTTHPGAIVGQAHLLQDVIDMLELGVDMKQRTLSYSLGSRSPLLAHLREHVGDVS